MAERRLEIGWRPREGCYPLPEDPTDPEMLRAVRLCPPHTLDYFIELLHIPVEEQPELKKWISVRLRSGWYGLPSFKFMGLLAVGRRQSAEGLEYAAPEMMALANLLSYRQIDTVQIQTGESQGQLRCAKDLGRVIALAYLAGRSETEQWTERWREALPKIFPKTWREHGEKAGSGLRDLLANNEAMENAKSTAEIGLLNGKGMGTKEMRAVAERLIVDAIEPFENSCH